MSRFQGIVDKLAGIEQFLLGKKLYLAAGEGNAQARFGSQ
jgi:hypothetical protein